MLGVVEFCVELEKVWPGFHEWPDTSHLVRENYFRKTFEVSTYFSALYSHLFPLTSVLAPPHDHCVYFMFVGEGGVGPWPLIVTLGIRTLFQRWTAHEP
jgi:hypothetical protein